MAKRRRKKPNISEAVLDQALMRSQTLNARWKEISAYQDAAELGASLQSSNLLRHSVSSSLLRIFSLVSDRKTYVTVSISNNRTLLVRRPIENLCYVY